MGPAELRQTSWPLAPELSSDSHALALSYPVTFLMLGAPCLTHYQLPLGLLLHSRKCPLTP